MLVFWTTLGAALCPLAPRLVPTAPLERRPALTRHPHPVAVDYDGMPLEPRDELKSRFDRGDGSGTRTSFTPSAAAPSPMADADAEAQAPSPNAALLAEIRALQPEPKAPTTEATTRTPVDLNGINPAFLVLGAVSYGAFSVLAWKFTTGSAAYFDAHQTESAFYVVNRLSSIARVVVIAMGALGTGVTCIAGFGQLALSVQVAVGISKGELDPSAVRVDPYGTRKKGELEKMLGFMLGDKKAGGG